MHTKFTKIIININGLIIHELSELAPPGGDVTIMLKEPIVWEINERPRILQMPNGKRYHIGEEYP